MVFRHMIYWIFSLFKNFLLKKWILHTQTQTFLFLGEKVVSCWDFLIFSHLFIFLSHFSYSKVCNVYMILKENFAYNLFPNFLKHKNKTKKNLNFWNEEKILGVRPFCNLLFPLPCWYIWITLGVIRIRYGGMSWIVHIPWANCQIGLIFWLVKKCQPIKLKIFYCSI